MHSERDPRSFATESRKEIMKPDTEGEGRNMADYKAKEHYQDEEIVEGYEGKRFSGPSGWLRDRLEKRAVRKALREVGAGSKILDMPCGTGRFSRLLQMKKNEVAHADISQEMLRHARKRSDCSGGNLGYIRCEAENLPFREGAFDSVLCFRFLPHLPVESRKRALSELARVSRGPLVIDYRSKYAFRSLSRWIRFRLGIAKKLRPRYSLSEISSELSEVGLSVVKWIPVVWLFSEKVVLLCRKHARAQG